MPILVLLFGPLFRTIFKILDRARGHLKLGQQVRSSNPTSQKVYRVTATMVEKLPILSGPDTPPPRPIAILCISQIC